jgi:ribulose-5-phosphate 4-epimerase/fuculose-1-phosphate aldolase
MLTRLGPNVWHDSPAQAMAVLEELEETAKLWLLAQPKPRGLGRQALEELEKVFGCRW